MNNQNVIAGVVSGHSIQACGGTAGYVRVDLYATDRGCVFSEFSSRPYGGMTFTPYAERYFGALWQQAFPRETP